MPYSLLRCYRQTSDRRLKRLHLQIQNISTIDLAQEHELIKSGKLVEVFRKPKLDDVLRCRRNKLVLLRGTEPRIVGQRALCCPV
jgi:hypothetical protein